MDSLYELFHRLVSSLFPSAPMEASKTADPGNTGPPPSPPWSQITWDSSSTLTDVTEQLFNTSSPARLVIKKHSFIHSMLPFVLGVVITAIIYTAFLVAYRQHRTRFKRLHAAAHAAALSGDAFLQLFRSDTGGLPTWLQSPDVDKSQWLNTAMEVLWPYIDKAGVAWAFKDHNLETLLNAQSFWKPSWMAASGVVLQSAMLGHVPPKVTGVKVYSPSDKHNPADSLVVDISFDWASKMSTIISMKTLPGLSKSPVDTLLSVVYKTVSIKVLVRDLVARGKLRVVVSPLLQQLPVAGAVRVSFLGAPSVSYQVSSLGANPLMIPGLEAWLNSFIANQVLEPFTFPQGFTIPVAELFGLHVMPPAVRPQGVLSVIVKSAHNVPRMDYFGLCDPYVKLYVTDKVKHRTSVKGNTLNPIWNEEFEFIIFDKEHQMVRFELLDSDPFSPDDLFGEVALDLATLNLAAGHINELELPVHRIGTKYTKKKDKKVDDRSVSLGQGTSRVPGPNQTPRVGVESLSPPDEQVAEHGLHTDPETRQLAHQVRVGKVKDNSMLDNFKFYEKLMPFKKECMLNVAVQYFPFTSAEAQLAEESFRGLKRTHTALSPRMRRILGGGMLYVVLMRAEGLSSQVGVTRSFRLVVKIGPRDGGYVYRKEAERTGVGRGLDARSPVFDQTLDFLVDGSTAREGDTMVTVEVWVRHLLLKDTFKGAATVPLQRILAAGRFNDTFSLERESKAGHGAIELGFEWQGLLDPQ